MAKPVILFILKRREDFDTEKHNAKGLSTGLFNSATFIVDMLIAAGIDARMEIVIDNNCIDRVVTQHSPTHVVLEALWVVPTKMPVLSKLHPNVKWIIRLHSDMPFLANEGMAMNWIGDFATQKNVYIAANAPRMLDEIKTFIRIKGCCPQNQIDEKVIFLPNFYPQNYITKEYVINKEYIDIGCFGAVRPLKNHMLQAVAAVRFAEEIGKKLRFHINVGKVETKGEPVMANLKAFFQHLFDSGHELISNVWTPREEFLLLCGKMDIGLQVSFSETFNIVGADIVSQGVPLVSSTEIPWANELFSASPTYSEEIFRALLLTHQNAQYNVESNQQKLTEYTDHTAEIWSTYFN